MLRLFSLFLVSNLIFGCAFPKAIVKAELSKNEVRTGEIFSYVVKIEGDFSSPRLELPDFGELKIVSQNQTRNYLFKGRKIILKIKLTYQLLAPRPGRYTIKGTKVIDRGKVYESKELVVKAVGKPLKKRKFKDFIEGAISI